MQDFISFATLRRRKSEADFSRSGGIIDTKLNLLKVLLCFVLLAATLLAQETEKYSTEPSDSLYRFQGIIPPVEYQYDLEEFFIEPLFNQIPDEVLFEDNPSNIWLRTELLISYNKRILFSLLFQ